MTWEIYRPRGEKSEKLPIVSLSKNSIVLNNISRERLNSNKLELAYNRQENTIRIKGLQEEESGIILKKTKIFAGGFFRNFQIDKKGKYVCEYNESENALYVKIS